MGKCSKGKNCIRSHGDNSEEKKDDKGKNKEKESGSKK